MSMILSASLGYSAKRDSKVVVVGAGIAGLTAAYRLQSEGMDVNLYEARNRVGGRIFTVGLCGRIAELGGQNIGDGGEASNLRRLIDEFGLQLTSSRIHLKRSYFNGKDLISAHAILKEKKFDRQVLKRQIDELTTTSCNMREILEKIVDVHDPLYEILAIRLAAYEGGSLENLSPLYGETLLHMLLGGISSVHQGNGEADNYVDLLTVEGGNAFLPEAIAESLGTRLHLEMPLTKIAKNKNGQYRLTFQNGEKIQADILILAMPCSVYEHIIFEDDVIPSKRLDAIRNVQYGANAKIMVPFTTPPTQTTGLIGNEMLCFFDCAEQILTIHCTGRTSQFSPDTITDAYIQAQPMIELGFGKDCPVFQSPTFAEDQAHLLYDGPVGYSWSNDPYARGSYSYIASGQENLFTATLEENGETFKTLFAPVRQSLYFAGEHASILTQVPGTMEAACESGERIARAILKNFRQQIPDS